MESAKNEIEKKNSKIKKSTLLVIICIVAVFVVGLSVFISLKIKASKNNFKPMEAAVVSIRSRIAEKQTLHDYVNTNGEISPQSSIDVFPSIGGKIYKVNVALGSKVSKGDVIAEIDPSEPGVQYAHSPVLAPISGTVTSSPLKQGTKVSISSPILTIGDVENLQVSANIPERYVSVLKTGLKANIILESYPDVIFKATVTRVSPVVDSRSRTKEVILNFDKKDPRINAGMFAKVTLFTREFKNHVVMPVNSIVEKNGKSYLYLVNDDETVRLVEITTGNSVDNEIQILTGVNVGDRVVIEGMRILADGSKIIDIDNHEKKTN